MRWLLRPTRDPVRFLVLVVVVEIVVATVLRVDLTRQLWSDSRGWQAWLGVAAGGLLLVVAYAVVLVARDHSWLRGQVRRRDTALQTYAEAASDWLWETTPELVLTYSSDRVQDVLGYSASEVVGRDAHDFMAASSARRSRQALLSGSTIEGWRDLDSEWLHADGRTVALRHSGAPIRDDSGALLGFRGTCRPAGREQQQARRHDLLSERVEAVLAAGDLSMALQPIIEIPTGRLVGAEALARFADGRPPDVWFAEAGEVGLRVELEMLAVRCALGRLTELPDHATISINACPDVLVHPEFTTMLLGAGALLDRVVIEITEHIRIAEYDALQTALSALRSAGAGLAVDDTGAGYASLTHVLRLRPDIVKLDRSLVAAVDSDRARRTLITALNLLALDIGAVVTAEGVETAAELETLADLGVDHAQGYLIGRPAVDLRDWPPVLLAVGGVHRPAFEV